MSEPPDAHTSSRPVVEIAEWSPQWAIRFDAVRAELAAVLPADATIEHIGSTSVVGMAAKPIIDVLLVVDDLQAVADRREQLERFGYRQRPWPDDADHLFFVRDTAGLRSEHVHVFSSRSPRPRSNRAFRDYLRTHPDAAERYAAAKRASAHAHPDSRAAYAEGKRAVFEQLLAQSADWDASGRAAER